MSRRIFILGLIILFLCSIPSLVSAERFTFTTISYPGASATYACGIDGNNIVGYYSDASGTGHGFLYDGSTYTTLDYPANGNTLLYGIDGSNIVGVYQEASVNNTGNSHGFIYNGSTFTLLDVPGFTHTEAHGISGNIIVGYCYNDAGSSFDQGFIYDGSTYTTFSFNPSGHTLAYDVDGNNIVGHYQEGSRYYGFLYNGSTYITLDFPWANFTSAHGISGNNIVGEYDRNNGNTHGFIYNGSTYISLHFPGSNYTTADGIDGNKIVGTYHNGQTYLGFLATATHMLSTKPIVTGFSLSSPSNSRTVSITTFTATDNLGVTGYMVTRSFLPPFPNSSKWSATPPLSFTFPSTVGSGTKTLYAWAKDAAGHVSKPLSTKVTLDLPSVPR